MHPYWTSLSHFKEGTLSSSLDVQAGSLSSRTVKQVFSISFFVIIPWAGPLVQY